MKTALITTTYLVPEERFKKTSKFLNYYSDIVNEWDIIVLDNASPKEEIDRLQQIAAKFTLKTYNEHYGRPSHLDYKYLWRAVHELQHYLKEYDKIVYMDNDFYILKKSMIDYINSLNSGWTTFWCNMYKFPETGCHIITKDCQEYLNFVNCTLEEFYTRHNGIEMEKVLPVTHVEKKFTGDRYGETNKQQTAEMDYYSQLLDYKTLLKFGK